jgi:hypothetical protein
MRGFRATRFANEDVWGKERVSWRERSCEAVDWSVGACERIVAAFADSGMFLKVESSGDGLCFAKMSGL